MTQAIEIVRKAFNQIGVGVEGEALEAEDALRGFEYLNDILDELRTEQLAVIARRAVPFSTVGNQASYTVGDGADWDVSRPTTIHYAFARVLDVDYPITLISDEAYWLSIDKEIVSDLPSNLYYQPTVPNGVAYVYPIPSQAIDIHIGIDVVLDAFLNINDDVDLPPGYKNMLAYWLALDLCPAYEKDPSPLLIGRAAGAKRKIKNTNRRMLLVNDETVLLAGRYNSRASSILTG